MVRQTLPATRTGTPMMDPMLVTRQKMKTMCPVSSNLMPTMRVPETKMQLSQPLVGRVFKSWPVGVIPTVKNEDHLSLESEKTMEFCLQ